MEEKTKTYFSKIFNNNKGKKRYSEDDQSIKCPRLKITRVDDSAMDVDNSSYHPSLTPSPSSPCPSPSIYSYSSYNEFYSYSNSQHYSQETTVVNTSSYASQEDNEISNGIKHMSIDNIVGKSRNHNDHNITGLVSEATIKGIVSVAQTFEIFSPLVGNFLRLGEEIIALYDKAKHNKELCGFLLKRCNCAMAAVRDLDMRKTENKEFFSRKENHILFMGFVECMRKMKKFISRISKLHKLVKYFLAASIEDDFTNLVTEFDGYMNSLNFSFTLQSRDELSKLSKMREEIRQIKEILLKAYEIPDDKSSCQDFLRKMDSVTRKNIEFQTRPIINSLELISRLEEKEPLLDGSQYYRTNTCPSKKIEIAKKIEKRVSLSCEEFCFKEFSSNPVSPDQFSGEETQFEIRRQVNILKELKDSDHIIRFYGVAKEDTKYYLVTEWMENKNLNEYYTLHGDSINLKTKIKFALDVCRGVAYLDECRILHHDIQSANILVSGHHKVKIANFGLSKKFSDITRNISHNLENIRYMAPEKLLFDNEEGNGEMKKKVSYDSKCEIYSVGALLWEIAELKKPHSDLNKTDMLVSIRKRVSEGYLLPFSKGIPNEWKYIVSKAMEFEPAWRPNISDICRDFYKLSKKYSSKSHSYDSTQSTSEIECHEDYDENFSVDENRSGSLPYITIKILSVNDAIRTHKSKNGNKQLAWESFKHHSSTNIEAKYWLGYYYYHDKEVPELQQINREKRNKIAMEIFKETADKGNPSAQLRYGIILWQGEGVGANSYEALKYLKSAADKNNSTAMYLIGKAYWNGGNGIDKDKNKGAEYLRKAARSDHPKAKEMCMAYSIAYY